MSTAEFEALLADLGWLRTLARQLARDATMAEDLVQDVCTIALRQRTPPSQWRAWLAEVLRNLWRAERRRAARRRRPWPGAEATAPDPSSTLQRVESQQRLVARVMQLAEPYRGVVLLRFFDQLPPRRIAERLGVPVATVHSRLQRALDQLRRSLDHDYGARRAWLAAFATFAWPTAAAPASRATVAPAASVAATVLLVLGGGLWWQQRSTEAAPATPKTPPPTVASSPNRTTTDLPLPQAERSASDQVVEAPARSSNALRGRVVDLTGAPVAEVRLAAIPGASRAEVEQQRAPVALGVSDAAGYVTGELAADAALLVAVDDRYEAVLLGQWTRTAPQLPIVVVAPAITLGGTVVDAVGQRLDHGQVELELPADAYSRLSARLDHTLESHWQSPLGPDGRFALGTVPNVRGARLRITSVGRAVTHVAAPEHSANELRLVVGGPEYRGPVVRGHVVHDDGRAAVGARVALGVTACTTDARGEFALPLGRVGAMTELVAATPGFAPARCPPPSSTPELATAWPADLLLRLGPATGAVQGRVVLPDGAAVAGAGVWLADPAPFGAEGSRLVQLEYFLAGAPLWSSSQPEVLLEPQVIEAPLATARQRTRWSHETEPTVTWHFVTTDAAGRFTVAGLLPRPYQLRAFDPTRGCFAQLAAVHAGDDVELVLATDEVVPLLHGQVRSQRGDPVPGVQVQQKFVPYFAAGPIAGGNARWMLLREGRATTTDADGAFALRDVGRRDTYLHLEGDHILPKPLPAKALLTDRAMVVTVELRCAIEVQLLAAAEADQVRAAGPDGAPAMLVRSHRNSTTFLDSVPLHEGRSGVFFVGEGAGQLQLLRHGNLVRTIPIQPDPARATLVE